MCQQMNTYFQEPHTTYEWKSHKNPSKGKCVFLRENTGAQQDIMVLLYQSCMRAVLEFAYTAWCNTNLQLLQKVHNMALRDATGAMG